MYHPEEVEEINTGALGTPRDGAGAGQHKRRALPTRPSLLSLAGARLVWALACSFGWILLYRAGQISCLLATPLLLVGKVLLVFVVSTLHAAYLFTRLVLRYVLFAPVRCVWTWASKVCCKDAQKGDKSTDEGTPKGRASGLLTSPVYRPFTDGFAGPGRLTQLALLALGVFASFSFFWLVVDVLYALIDVFPERAFWSTDIWSAVSGEKLDKYTWRDPIPAAKLGQPIVGVFLLLEMITYKMAFISGWILTVDLLMRDFFPDGRKLFNYPAFLASATEVFRNVLFFVVGCCCPVLVKIEQAEREKEAKKLLARGNREARTGLEQKPRVLARRTKSDQQVNKEAAIGGAGGVASKPGGADGGRTAGRLQSAKTAPAMSPLQGGLGLSDGDSPQH